MSSNGLTAARESEDIWVEGQERDNSATKSSRERRAGAASKEAKSTRRAKQRHHTPQESKELYFHRDVTRDSMVDNLLSSFNRIPDGEAPYGRDETTYPDFDSATTPEPQFQLTYDKSQHQQKFSESDFTPTNNDSNPSAYLIQPKSQTATPTSKVRDTNTGFKASRAPGSGMDTVKNSPAASAPNSTSPKRSELAAKDVQKISDVTRGPRPSRSSSFDLNPADDSKRRDRDALATASVLNRRRPVPVQYHNFDLLSIPPGQPQPESDSNSRSSSFATNSAVAQSTQVRSPSENFRPQTSSRNKVATLTGSDAVLANNQDPKISAQDHQRQVSNPAIYGAENATSSYAYSPLEPQLGHAATERPRERQGFFKRVFGSSRNAASIDAEAPQLPPLAGANRADQKPTKTPTAPAHGSQRMNSSSKIAPEDFTTSVGDSPHVVQKKTSFFRRLKKNPDKERVDSATHPLPPGTPKVQRAPSASSLRQVMDPFLTSQTSPQQQFYDTKERQSADVGNREDDIVQRSFQTRTTESAPLSQVFPASSTGPRPSVEPASTKSIEEPTGQDSMRRPSATQTIDSYVSNRDGARSITPSARSVSHSDSPAQFSNLREDTPSSNLSKSVPSQPNLSTPTKSATHPPLSLSLGKLVRTDDDDHFVASPVDITDSPLQSRPNGPRRVLSNEKITGRNQTLPGYPAHQRTIRQVSGSSIPIKVYESPTEIPILQVDGESGSPRITAPFNESSDPFSPRQEDHEQAKALFEGHDRPAMQQKTSALLGSPGPNGERLRRAYMALYDFAGLNILLAMRDLCGRLNLRGETQQVDRILASFADRWCNCNPEHGFKSQDIVHTITYSILLLNTDLYAPDLDQRMTRTQFVKNTLPTIRQMAEEKFSGRDSTLRAAQSGSTRPSRELRSPSPFSSSDDRPSLDTRTSEGLLSVRASPRPTSELSGVISPSPGEARTAEISSMLVDAPFEGTLRAWEMQVELVLREFYASIRQQHLPLHATAEDRTQDQTSSNNLSVAGSDLTRRGSYSNRNVPDSLRPRPADSRSIGSKWGAKTRSAQKFYQASTRGSSRTSLDEQSVWSPTASSTWSKSYFGKGYGSISSDTLATHATQDYGYQQSIGFANALSHAIIREEGSHPESDAGSVQLLEDETLELVGAPWAKEGIAQHKHHLETTDKKAKDRNWNECFLVVEKGWMRLFSFNSKASARSLKNKSVKGAVVGGGNWMENAESVGNYMLRQSIANVLPPPGYSKTRPHVFALSLPTGAVHLFHVGTPEIAREFVSTANYWSARLSKEPLVGGVSNVEYGWSENIVNTALLNIDTNTTSSKENAPPSSAAAAIVAGAYHSPKASGSHKRSLSGARPSLQGSLRSSIDLQTGSARAKLPGDKVALSEWKPPQQSLVASTLKEDEQLQALRKYVSDVEEDLAKHNELRPGLTLAFSPRHPNSTKAMANWERKSSYLLREIVKFRTYIDSLAAARAEADKIKEEREERAKEREVIASAVGT